MMRKPSVSPEKDTRTRRRRGADATRRAILEAAREAWTAHAYNEVGLREIAGSAGVTAALVNRYFGTKAALFREAIGTEDPSPIPLATVDRSRFGDTIARALLATEGRAEDGGAAADDAVTGFDPIRMLLRSAAIPDAQPILRDYVETTVMPPLAEYFGGDDAPERAVAVLALALGTTVLGEILRIHPIVDDQHTPNDRLLEVLRAMLQPLAEAPAP